MRWIKASERLPDLPKEGQKIEVPFRYIGKVSIFMIGVVSFGILVDNFEIPLLEWLDESPSPSITAPADQDGLWEDVGKIVIDGFEGLPQESIIEILKSKYLITSK